MIQHKSIRDRIRVLGKMWFKGFNGIRGIGALMVVATHIGSLYWFKEIGLGALNAVFYGGVGVTWFYVLSGFLITILLIKEEERTGDLSPKLVPLRS